MSNAPIEIIEKLLERKNQPVERVPHGTGTATATAQLLDIASVPLERLEQRNSLALPRSRFLSSKRSGTSNTSNEFDPDRGRNRTKLDPETEEALAIKLLTAAKRQRLAAGRQSVTDPYARRRWVEPTPPPFDIVEQARAALSKSEEDGTS